MEEKKDEGELMKHACKLCKKIYPSGKSLGGHMRSHMIANSQKNKPIIPKKVVNKFDYDDEDEDDDDEEDEDEEDDIGAKNSGYGLRENPKKTWRLVGSTFKKKQAAQFQTQQQQQVQEEERICKQCGKGFQSLKALCGHMSSHSERERDRNFHNKVEEEDDDDCSWSSDSKDQLISAMESHSDNNNNGSISIMNSKRETRSSMSRYKHYRSLNANANTNTSGVDSVSPNGNGNGNGNGSSSNHSEIDQHEQEEVAICLMMLSRDSSSSLHFNFTTAESSDNNSVILEGGSSSNYVGIKRKHLSSLIKDDDQNKVIHEMDNSDSGYFENGAKELESDASVDAFYFSKPNIDIINTTGSKESFHFNSSDSPQSDENSNKKKRINNTQYCYSNNANHNNVVSKKGSKYECGVCQKTFNTHQALGGHIISHSRKTLNADNTFLETTTKISPKKVVVVTHSKSNKPTKPKKGKGHNCPFCPRVFKSGQALGGHKRSHMMGSSSNYVGNLSLERERERERERVRPSPRHQPEEQPKQPTLIDLNLPAPMDEEGSGNSNSQFVASW